MVREHRAGPAVFDGLVGIPEPDSGSVQLGQEQAVMSPGNSEMGAGGADVADSLTGCERIAVLDSLTTCESFSGIAGQAR